MVKYNLCIGAKDIEVESPQVPRVGEIIELRTPDFGIYEVAEIQHSISKNKKEGLESTIPRVLILPTK